MPNFLLIGAGKAGTTALWHYLGQHPGIYMSPEKEPRFFCFEELVGRRDPSSRLPPPISNLRDYRSLFEGVTTEQAIGEATPIYLYRPRAAERIRQELPAAKLIAVLRHPVERAHSQFLHNLREDREPVTDFCLALREEDARVAQRWPFYYHYRRRGLYHQQLERYSDWFASGQIRVFLYEELLQSPLGVLQSIFRFLGVDDAFVPDTSVRHNVGIFPRNRALHSFLMGTSRLSGLKRPFPSRLRQPLGRQVQLLNARRSQLTDGLRKELAVPYRDDVLRLEGMLGRDLSEWLR